MEEVVSRRTPGAFPQSFTTEMHLVAEGRCRFLAFVLTPGHYGDGHQLERVLQVSVLRTGVVRPRTRADRVLADKAYTSLMNLRYLRRRGIRHTIPERLDQQRRSIPATRPAGWRTRAGSDG
ncbi:transposase [Streptomyces sp. NPDC014991]|uniref:transposase n=1 Tax=Streptomyces sp. NPDC014991 TaxID=3364935 RepID=UPI0036FDAAE2